MKLAKQTLTLIFILFFVIVNSSFAQKKYFQQEVNYKIIVSLDDVKNTLSGSERITYTNNSPDELKELYFHLWPNAYKNNSTALCKQMMRDGNLSLYKATPQERGYIDQLEFNVNGQPVKWQLDSVNIDICKLTLNFPLKTGDSITITTPFFVKIPDAKFSRLGHVGQSYMITQWYPKPAVYDANGWHAFAYLNQGEFYSEYGSFDVTITVPENYVVAATGNLQTESEKKFIESKIQETNAKSSFDYYNAFPASSTSTKTIRYTLSKIHDFAWFADKRFNVAKKTVTLAGSVKTVDCYAFFTNAQPELWKKGVEYVADAVFNYSKWVGDYPYETCTAVDGTISAGGGMEYPTITNIGKVGNATLLDDVIAHEVGHNWFYGILGSNEHIHAWMDEGINSFYEARYMSLKHKTNNYLATYLGIKPSLTSALGFNDFSNDNLNQLAYLAPSRQNGDQPIELEAEKFSAINYGGIVYSKTALTFLYLNNYLGDKEFDSVMQVYFNTWKFKHPQPEDIKQVFKESTGKNLDWFFNDMLASTKKLDYKISSVKRTGDGYEVKIKNTGDIAAPFSITGFNDSINLNLQWQEGFTGARKFEVKEKDVTKVIINSGNSFLDIDENNNSVKTSGLFKKLEPLQLSFFSKYENPQRTQIFYLPAIGYNFYNGVMGGIVLHNISFLKKKFEYAFAPMYGFQSKSFAGTGYLNYSLQFPGKSIDNLEFSSSPKYFAYSKYDDAKYLNYYSIPLSVAARFKKPINDPFIEYHVKANFISNSLETFDGESGSLSKRNQFFTQAIFMRENFDKLDPGNFTLTFEEGEKYVKGFFDAQKTLTVGKLKKAFDVRLFAGSFFMNDRNDGLANFQTSAWRGDKDYLLSEMYSGRSERTNFWSQQMINKDGGLKAYYPVGTNKWMIGVNASFKLPLNILKVYADAAMFAKPENAEGNKTWTRYDAGICVTIFKDVMEVYFPLIYSTEIKNFYELNNYKYADKIRFVFDIKKLNPAKLRDSVSR